MMKVIEVRPKLVSSVCGCRSDYFVAGFQCHCVRMRYNHHIKQTQFSGKALVVIDLNRKIVSSVHNLAKAVD
jgi:hypothetical protein